MPRSRETILAVPDRWPGQMSTNEHKFVVVHDKVVICGKNKIRYFVRKIYVVYLYVDSVIVSTLII